MPRGIPKSGKRKPRVSRKMVGFEPIHVVPEIVETDEQIATKISERFDILKVLVNATVQGEARSLIVSGPAGLGKSYTVEEALRAWDPSEMNHTFVKGYVKATGLYRLLWQFRMPGQIIVFDDADTIFFDDTSLNFLKAVCDTNDRRRVSYRADYDMADKETGETIPDSFDFEGTIIFITNLDFDALIDRGNKLAPHLQAMMSRSHYIDLAMKNKQDYVVRIKQVVAQGLLRSKGLNVLQEKDVVDFIVTNRDKMRELSLRMALKVGMLRKMNPTSWEKMARVTCCKVA